MNIISVRRSIPLATMLENPLEVILDLPGPYINGINIWMGENPPVSNITLRMIEPPATKLFPEPSATIRTPITEAQEDGWFHPTPFAGFIPLRIVVSGDPRYRVILQLCNTNVVPSVDIIVNLSVSTVPPDQTTLELLKEMSSTIQRVPEVTGRVASKMMKETLQKELGVVK